MGRKPKVIEPVTEKPKRQYIQAPVVNDVGLPCPHCGERYNHRVTVIHPNGVRRMMCQKCNKPFPAKRLQEALIDR
jgi:hypothetical protein